MDIKRVGFVGIVVEDRKKSAEVVNHILTDYGDSIVARVGIPYHEKNVSIITLVVDMSTNELGALTGKLGGLEGVSVKSALTKQ